MTARAKKNACLAAIVGVVVLGWLTIALFEPGGGPNSLRGRLTVSLVLGTIFGQTSLAAAWCALGPIALVRRLPLSFLWLAAIVLAFGANVARNDNPGGLGVLLLYAVVLLVQWLVVQVPLWLAVARYGIHIDEQVASFGLSRFADRQFGIREIMILTAVVGAVLGAARLMFGGLGFDGNSRIWEGAFMLGLIALANAALAIPPISAILLTRMALSATTGALIVVALATVIELSLLPLVWPGPKFDTNDYWVISLFNLFQCAWIIVVLSLLRAAGFRLMARPINGSSQEPKPGEPG